MSGTKVDAKQKAGDRLFLRPLLQLTVNYLRGLGWSLHAL